MGLNVGETLITYVSSLQSFKYVLNILFILKGVLGFHSSLMKMSSTYKNILKSKFWKHFELISIILKLSQDYFIVMISYHSCMTRPVIEITKHSLGSEINLYKKIESE